MRPPPRVDRRTSTVVIGAAPVLVALIAATLGQTATRPLAWAGYAVAIMGIALVARLADKRLTLRP